jgi:hypothetical protein
MFSELILCFGLRLCVSELFAWNLELACFSTPCKVAVGFLFFFLFFYSSAYPPKDSVWFFCLEKSHRWNKIRLLRKKNRIMDIRWTQIVSITLWLQLIKWLFLLIPDRRLKPIETNHVVSWHKPYHTLRVEPLNC